MPLPKGTRFRWKTNSDGTKVRLAFAKGTNKVIEVKKEEGKAHKVSRGVRYING